MDGARGKIRHVQFRQGVLELIGETRLLWGTGKAIVGERGNERWNGVIGAGEGEGKSGQTKGKGRRGRGRARNQQR